MRYEDRIIIATPEGLEVELTLAGIGSRFIAALIDTAIKAVAEIGLILIVFGLIGISLSSGEATNSAYLAVAAFFIITFLIIFGYDVAFETLSSGKTPGKRWTGLRVVKTGGHPVGFLASTTRNLLRIVDALPGLYPIAPSYGVGIVAVVATRNNQRLGDMAAGTVVVRDRKVAPRSPAGTREEAAAPDALRTWDVSAVTADELATVRRFLERKGNLTPQARAHLASELAERLRPKVGGAPEMVPEEFLEALSRTKAQRS